MRDIGVRLKAAGKRLRVGHMTVHAHGERLDAANQQERVERPQHATRGILDEAKSLRDVRAVGDDEACHEVAVSAKVFRRRMDDNVGSKHKRLLEVGSHESVVHD